MKTQNFIKNGSGILVAIFTASLLTIGFTGCGGGGSSSTTTDNPNSSPLSTKITVLDGYIVGATVKDSANKFAVEEGKGVYKFTGGVTYPVTSSGGQIDLDGDGIGDKVFDTSMSAKNGGIISPLTDGTDFSSIVKGNLAFDYIKDNNASVAKLAQISYFFEKENKRLELKNVLKNNIFNSPEELSMYVSTSSDLSQNAKDAFLKIAQSDETNATKIEEEVLQFKELQDVNAAQVDVPVPTITANNITVTARNASAINATFTDAATKSYTSSDATIATVDTYGNVTGVSEGTAAITITATNSENETATKTIVVTVNAAQANSNIELVGDVLNISNFSTGDVIDISYYSDIRKVKVIFGTISYTYKPSFEYMIDGDSTTWYNGNTGNEHNASNDVFINATWGNNVNRLRFMLQDVNRTSGTGLDYPNWIAVKVK